MDATTRTTKRIVMPIIIDGKKISLHDIKGTDTYCVHEFLNKTKGKCAIMVYIDSDGEIAMEGVWRTKKALNHIIDNVHLDIKGKRMI